MRLPVITFVLLACVCFTIGDVAHLKAAKAKLVGRLLGKHHKRGTYSAVPTFKLGHDIPVVSHSVVKPVVVTYPPTASVASVKVPVIPPYSRLPISVGHKIPHTHFGLKHAHHTKTVIVPKPDQHYHHHHHHVKPVIPVHTSAPAVPAAPLFPIPQPTATVVRPIPAPSPAVAIQSALPEHVLPTQNFPLARPHIPAFPPHFPLKQLVPLAPIQPASAVSAAAFPLTPQFPYVIRPGNAVQTSFFATYPRYPLLNYQNSLLPLAAPGTSVLSPPIAPARPILFDRPHLHHLLPQTGVHEGVFDHAGPGLPVEPTPTLVHPTQAVIPQPAVHLQPAQPTVHFQPVQPTVHLHPGQQPGTVPLHPTPSAVPLDHDGWSPVSTQPQDLGSAQLDSHFLDTHHFTQEQGTQVYEHHTGGDQQYNDYQNQLQHHIQHQLDQAQFEQNLNNQHQLNQEYGAPQQEFPQPNDFRQNQDFAQHAHEYAHHVQEYAQHGQDYAQTNEYSAQQQPGQEYGQPGQEYGHPGQEYGQPGQEYGHPGQEYSQPGQEYGHPGQEYSQPGQEYGHPGQEYSQPGQDYGQGIEGRSSDGEEDMQRYHNHIPLGLQPPIDRPLEHFR